jgi:hypothetical protein
LLQFHHAGHAQNLSLKGRGDPVKRNAFDKYFVIVRRAARILLDLSSPNGADVATATLSLTLTCFSPLPPKYELPLVTTPHGVEVSLPAAMAIGAYDGQVRFKSGDVIDCPAPIVVLANAFAEEDDVYMPQPAERDEYVLEETGMIWNGSVRGRVLKAGARAGLLCSLCRGAHHRRTTGVRSRRTWVASIGTTASLTSACCRQHW